MEVYTPSDVPTDVQSIGYVRQNPWRCLTDDGYENVRISKKIHIPWSHTKNGVEEFRADPEKFITESRGAKYIQRCLAFPIGSTVLIPNGRQGILVRIVSEVKAGIIDTLYVTRVERVCHHTITNSGECLACHNSVSGVYKYSDSLGLQENLKDGYIIEPFYSLYLDVEILGDADYNGKDGRKMAGMESVGNMEQYWSRK